MRKIDFRMWNPVSGKFMDKEVMARCLEQQMLGVYDHEKEYGAVFEQYTGLKDKNGVDIYVGDIIIFNHSKFEEDTDGFPCTREYSRNYVIERVNTFFTYGLRARNKSIFFNVKQSTLCTHEAIVIGNIHQHSELLEVTK